jgi:site-specific DNA recombinase
LRAHTDEWAFYGSQYAAVAPLFEHYGVQLWMPEAGGRVDFASEHDEKTMTGLGLSSKREITRTSIRGPYRDDGADP